jgi:hypothetical protein
MKKLISLTSLCIWLLISVIIGSSLAASLPQRRKDHLNRLEVLRVQEAQEIDQRTKVFLRIADRRLKVLLGLPVEDTVVDDDDQEKKDPDKKDKKNKDKDKDKNKDKAQKSKEKEDTDINNYGPPPQGNNADLLANYQQVISEMMDKLDDSFEKSKTNPALKKAIDKLLSTGKKQLGLLEKFRPTNDDEDRALRQAKEVLKMALDGAKDFNAGS